MIPSTTAAEIITEPSPNDILCGKDKECLRHEGSRRFKSVIQSYQSTYHLMDSKLAKMNLIKAIFERLKQTSARFLKFNHDVNGWVEIDEATVRNKIGHALRTLKPQKNSRGGSCISRTFHSKKSENHRTQNESCSALYFASIIVAMSARANREFGASNHLKDSNSCDLGTVEEQANTSY